MGGLLDFLFSGTQGDARRANTANVRESLNYLGGVPIEGLFDRARGSLRSGRADIAKGYSDALAAVGGAGTGASLDTLSRERGQVSGFRQGQAQRGLYGSSATTRGVAGIRGQTDRTLAGIEGTTGALLGGLAAGRGEALGRAEQGTSALRASLFAQEAGAELGRAQGQAGVLANTQVVGSPGVFGQLLGVAGAGLTGSGANSGGAGAAAGILSTCCFIAVAAYGLPLDPSLRAYRDEKMTVRTRRGYYVLAEWLVPKMLRPIVHAAVRIALVDPFIRYTKWRYGQSNWGWLMAPVTMAWIGVFAVLGTRRPLVRSNGEVV